MRLYYADAIRWECGEAKAKTLPKAVYVYCLSAGDVADAIAQECGLGVERATIKEVYRPSVFSDRGNT